jgi:hypothetical protein
MNRSGKVSNNESWDREEENKKYFDPEDVTEWLKYSPEEFIGLMINEIRRETISIAAWSKLLDEHPQFRSQTFHFNQQEIPATFITETLMRSARIITRLLDTAGVYREAVSKKGT